MQCGSCFGNKAVEWFCWIYYKQKNCMNLLMHFMIYGLSTFWTFSNCTSHRELSKHITHSVPINHDMHLCSYNFLYLLCDQMSFYITKSENKDFATILCFSQFISIISLRLCQKFHMQVQFCVCHMSVTKQSTSVIKDVTICMWLRRRGGSLRWIRITIIVLV